MTACKANNNLRAATAFSAAPLGVKDTQTKPGRTV